MLTNKEAIEQLGTEWETGFLWHLRNGSFDKDSHERIMAIVKQIQIKGSSVETELVSLLWYIPVFMFLQEEYVVECGSISQEEYRISLEAITEQLSDILGMP